MFASIVYGIFATIVGVLSLLAMLNIASSGDIKYNELGPFNG